MAEFSQPPQKIRRSTPGDEQAMGAWLVERKWMIIEQERELQEKAVAMPAQLAPLPQRCSQVEVLHFYLPNTLWTKLAEITNRNLAKRPSSDSRYQTTTVEELKKWYGFQLVMENTYSNSFTAIAVHFAHVKRELGSVRGLGLDRFSVLSNDCCPTAEELIQLSCIIEGSSKSQLLRAKVVVIDESVIGYQPSEAVRTRSEREGTPIPVVYIPRKPHPNGLLCYLASTYVSDPNSPGFLPFIVSMVPHVRIGDFTNAEAAKHIINSWMAPQPHWIVDAGFGSEELVQLATQRGGSMTASISQVQMGSLWKALSFSVPPGCWRAATNGTGMVASVHCGEADGRGRTLQRILSSNWELPVAPHQFPSAECPGGDDDKEVEGSDQVIPTYSRETLEGHTVVQLKEICRKWGIKPAVGKEAIIQGIVTRVEIVHKKHSDVEAMERILGSQYFHGDGPLHQVYKSHFNWVDLADRSWNMVEEHHPHRDWKIKYLLLLLRFAVLNAMTHSKQNHGENWKQFRATVARQLIQT